MTISIDTANSWAAGPPKPVELALNAPSDTPDGDDFNLFGEDGFTFGDAVDIVNPLQHLPFISTFYRNETGDEIAPAPRVMGSTLFFGPIGLVGALANVMVEESTGQDIGEHVASWFGATDDDAPTDQPAVDVAAVQQSTPQLAANDPVISWARAEMDWARKSAADGSGGKLKSDPGNLRTPPESIPDATPLLRQEEPWAALQEQQINTASFVQPRHAASAYLRAGNLGEEAFG